MGVRFTIHTKMGSGVAETLCWKCAHGTVAEGRSRGGGIRGVVKCAYLEGTLDFKVESCNSFRDPSKMGLHEMRNAAWILVNDTKKSIGFVHPRNMDQTERWKLLESVEDVD